MNRRTFLHAVGWGIGGGTWAVRAGAGGAARPNFLWILSEDNAKHYLRLFWPTGAPAPTIEKLAHEGIAFDNAFSNAPVCSAARTTLMTGVLGPRAGFHYHRKLRIAGLPGALRMFPFYLRQAGYYCTNRRKKDYNAVEGQGVWDESSGKASWRRRPSKQTPFFHMETTAVSHEGRLHFSRKEMETTRPHTDPKTVTLAPYHPDTSTFRYTYARYLDCMGAIDREVARLVGELEKDGLLEDTFIFYYGDHGGVLPGSKGYICEAGLNVPLVVRIPSKWQHLVPMPPGSRSDAFVSFIDFGPTLLHLAGIDVPPEVDGRPFLGTGVTSSSLATYDSTFSYADRFDEKYDFCRALRKGRFKYRRNYQSYYPDGLQNNYRYRMLAYQEWRQLYRAGKLDPAQRRFFEAKPVEELYDIETDPHEVRNLAGDSAHAATLKDLRARLQKQVRELPDLSFYPESHLIAEALDDGVAYGRTHRDAIGRLADIADLSLEPFEKARTGVVAALKSTDRWERYWALTVCSCFGKAAASLADMAKARCDDSEPLVRVRAAEFLAVVGAGDPRPTLYDVLNRSRSEAEALIALNTAVYVNDHLQGYPFDAARLNMSIKGGELGRRIEYLSAG